MSQNAQPHLSLLSLSIAAANAAPIPAESAGRSPQGPTTNITKHRRLSSAGRSRRRLSDARDAATRPFPTPLQTASASFAALSLSSPTMAPQRLVPGAQPIQVARGTSAKGTSDPELASVDDTHLSMSPPQSHSPLASNSVNVAKSGRKRGTIFTCESCSKVYRHPSCLIKHRWEHTPQWREASKFVLSKHQQVQLLEAAAILSHLSPSSASLPEDRSLWPSFLSGGLVPPPTSMSNSDIGPTPPRMATATATLPASAANPHTSFPVSSSVPASTVLDAYRTGQPGPQLHDYAIGEVGITQVRPGMLGVPTAFMSAMNGKSSPVPVPASAQTTATTTTTEDDALNLLALREASMTSESWGSPTSVSLSHSRSHSYSHARARAYTHTHAHSHSLSYLHTHPHSHSLSLSHTLRERERRRSNAYEYGFVSRSGSGFGFGHDYSRAGSSGYVYAPEPNGGWSLPRSSVRSKSGSSGSVSGSQSASESRSDDEDDRVFGNVDVDPDVGVSLDGDEDVGADLEDGIKSGVGAATMSVRQGIYGSRVRAWKGEDGKSESTGPSVREDEQEDTLDGKYGDGESGAEQTWDGMEMEMEMD